MANDSVNDLLVLKKDKKEKVDREILWNVAILCETVEYLEKEIDYDFATIRKVKEGETFQRLLKIKEKLKALVLSNDYMEVSL